MTEQKKLIHKMTRREFMNVPFVDAVGGLECDELVIVPTGSNHSSGYKLMHIVACKNVLPIGTVSTSCDNLSLESFDWNMIHVNGVSGLNILREWRIDCLPTSRLIRIWGHNKSMRVYGSGSDVSIEGFKRNVEG
jgi:hypothetical protein